MEQVCSRQQQFGSGGRELRQLLVLVEGGRQRDPLVAFRLVAPRAVHRIEQLTAAVKQNADNAKQAHELTRKATAVVSEGGQVVAGVITTMDAIHGSARKVE